ncbi:MAG: NADH-quinone oxidoreductase subunit N, partial [Candidatus Kapabacteria bacterium]|nr:NADH-quinone oxidoreductase subunit N [Candidatus Kapabacteria bacterium]
GALLLTIPTFWYHGTAFQNMITVGGYSAFFDVLFLIGGLLTLFAGRPYIAREHFDHDEFYSLIMFSVAGMMVIGHSNNLLISFIGIEIMSVSFYVLSGYLRKSIRSIESALKYFLLGSFATGFLVFGIALLYGATGTLEFPAMHAAVVADKLNFPNLLTVGIALVLIGLSFKAAAFPFHQWAPDVYEGAPTVVTAFMSTAGKAASLSALIPVIAAVVPQTNWKVGMVLAVISAATMLVGNISAVVQSNIKRMLAYSSVAHAGYLMMGFVANNPNGMTGVLFYSAAYLFMQIGAFVIVSLIEKENDGNLQLADYAGLSKRNPVLAALMALFMFSLAGIPPMAGFFGKYYLFIAAVEAGYTWLTIVAVISSMISVYFYIGLVVTMYFKDSTDTTEQDSKPGLAGVTLAISCAFVIILGLFPQLIEKLAHSFFM